MQTRVGKQVLVSRIEEEFGVLDPLDETAGGVQIAVIDEEFVGIHRVDLNGDAFRPGRSELRGRHARMKQQCSLRSGAGLCEHLRGHHSEGEAPIHKRIRQLRCGGPTALENGVESDVVSMGDAVLQRVEGTPFIKIGGVDDVAGLPEFLGECEEPRRLSVRVMKQKYLGHTPSSQEREAYGCWRWTKSVTKTRYVFFCSSY